ncbi:MAG: hypothetical protein AAF570_19185, partial [Bacteroidota bacterium]
MHPADPNFLIEGNDGGLAISRDRGKSWEFAENLPLAQFYHINVDDAVPYNIMGGMQDNGSWVGPSEVWAAGGIRNHYWREVAFGDGFDVMAKPGDNRTVYAMSQGGFVNRIDKETGESVYIKPIHPEGEHLRFSWNAAIAQDPFEPCKIYFGSQYLHRSTDCGDSWTLISGDLTTNDSTKQKQALSGGLTIDATEAENFTTILAIAPSPLQKDLIWVGTDDGQLQMTRDGGVSWKNMSAKLPGMPKGAWIPQIEVSKHTAGEVFVVVNDYRRNNWAPYLYHSRDYGATWRRIADEKSVDGYALSVVQDPVQENLLFLGTDHGLFFSIDYGANWTKWDKGFPSVPTRDMKIHPREHDLVLGTWGRAAWVLDDITPLRQLAKDGEKMLEKDFILFPVYDCINAEYRSVDEGRFLGQSNFRGRNQRRGAVISLWIKEPKKKKGKAEGKGEKNDKGEKDEKGKKKADKAGKKDAKGGEKEMAGKKGKMGKMPPGQDMIEMAILNMNGDTIRNYEMKPDTGLMRFTWGLQRNGIDYPRYN